MGHQKLSQARSNRIGALLELLWNCAESCTVCIDMLYDSRCWSMHVREVVLSVLASENR